MLIGPALGLVLSYLGYSSLSNNWIKPFGDIFINLLKLIAIPLVLVSVTNAIASFRDDPQNLTRKGLKTLGIYMFTTISAVSIGLLIANVTKPGSKVSPEIKILLREKFEKKYEEKAKTAEEVKKQSPIQPIVDMFPSNIFSSLADTKNMLQVITFAILLGLAIMFTDPKYADPVKDLFHGLNEVLITMVDLIMKLAPYGVFALLCSLVTEIGGDNPIMAIKILAALGYYSLIVVLGLGIMIFLFYPLMIKIVAGYDPKKFFKGMIPAMTTAFYTSSSAATLSVTMKCVKENLGISKKTADTVLPLGATINMDGTSLYQAVAALFIAQAYNLDLSITQQLGILATATLASIGAAAVPGAGIVMLVIVLEQAQVPTEGIALIFAVDRILDMCRTMVNVTGDASVCILVDKK
ncbi:MAG: dicarboxylate/amino acid:cation symporter [Leptospiraceae bacterium]|nr:dicarboxylate/amino acid:cation symporter [Leptospiraceae bacterium]